MRKVIPFVLAAGILTGCTTVDTVTPEQRQLANLRSELTSSRSDVRSLANQLEDLATRCNSLEKENASLRSNLGQLQNSIREVSTKADRISQSASKTEDIAALNKAYQQLVGQLRTMNEANLESQRKIDKNLQVIQGDAKTLQSYIQENRNKIASFDSRISEVERVARQAASAASQRAQSASTTVRQQTQQTTQKIVRTGKPSSPNITYDSLYEHTVAPGESIWMIARDYGVAITDIYNVNENLNSTSLNVGQKLRVPKRTDQ